MLVRSPIAVGLLAGLTALVVSTRAEAFCRTTTCHGCTQPLGECVTSGIPVFWAENCLSYDLQQDASVQVSLGIATEVAARAFSHWQDVICPSANASPSIKFLDLGPVSCNRVEFNENGGNANLIVFRDTSWADTNGYDPTSTLALTTITFNVKTGQLYDADIEINGQMPLNATDASVPDAFDLESVLTHEAGHFLGLAHSDAPCDAQCPTMHASYTPGATACRTLEADDIAGICTVYPPGRVAASNTCVPMGGLSSECGFAGAATPTQSPAQGGCAIAHSGQIPLRAHPFATLGAIVTLVALRWRRTSSA
jgi:hypothetical protein